ncbi:MAG: protein phosphatase 2C domain-containing protein [Polyangiaceae bacterium]
MSSTTTQVSPRVECGYFTDPGRDPDKQVNEDSGRHGPTPRGYLAIVCDGMGGHEGGQEASRAAVQTIFECVENAPPEWSHREALERAIEAANRKVYALAKPTVRARPGSTVVAVLVHEGGAEVAHVGDSRVYLFHAGEMQRLTLDHSAVQMMVDAGAITPEQAKVHPDANVITRALGMAPDVEVDARPEPFPYVPGDVFLLCSDGLCDLVGEPDMPPAITMAPTLAAAAAELTELANSRGGYDNITVLLLRTLEQSHGARDVRPTLLDGPAGAGSRGATVVENDTLVTEPLRAPGAPGAAPQTLLMGPIAGGAPQREAGPPREAPQAAKPGAAATKPTPAHAGPPPLPRAAIPANPHKSPAKNEGRPAWLLPLVLSVGLLAVVIGAGLLFLVIREERKTSHRPPIDVPVDGADANVAPPQAPASNDALVPVATSSANGDASAEPPMVHPRDLLQNRPVSPAGTGNPSSMPRR